MLQRLQKMSPQLRLRVLSGCFIAGAGLLFVLGLTSLAGVASNLMVTAELSTEAAFESLSNEYPLYLLSQRLIVAFDVLTILLLPLLVFSVFKFYTKGNFIIVVLNITLHVLRWIAAVMFLAGESGLRESWENLWEAADYGQSKACHIDTCDSSLENALNYVVCAKLELWSQTYSFEMGYAIIGVLLVGGVSFLALRTNHLDVSVVEFAEQSLE